LFGFYSAGYLNPRLLVKAQQKIAKSLGCQIIAESVEQIKAEEEEEEGFVLECTSGQKIKTKKIIIAAGVYSG
jgi:glycine/D-amino acid oxidase-like deaminating enzyme